MGNVSGKKFQFPCNDLKISSFFLFLEDVKKDIFIFLVVVASCVGRVHLPPPVFFFLFVLRLSLAAFTTFCQGWPLVLFGFLGRSTYFQGRSRLSSFVFFLYCVHSTSFSSIPTMRKMSVHMACGFSLPLTHPVGFHHQPKKKI